MAEDRLTWRLYATDENETTVTLEARRTSLYPARFLTMFPQALTILASFERPPAYYRALFAALPMLDPVQYRALSAREVAENSGLSKVSAERALTMLEADGVILSNGMKTAGKRRRLNSSLFWASKASAYPDEDGRDPMPEDARGR